MNLEKLNVDGPGLERLHAEGLRSARDLALEYRGRAAELALVLEIPEDRAAALIDAATATIPPEKLAEWLAIAERVRTYPFGACAPREPEASR